MLKGQKGLLNADGSAYVKESFSAFGERRNQCTWSGPPTQGIPGFSTGFGSIQQGFLESSNVNLAEEMVNMIIAQRSYEINSKAIQAADEMMAMANNLRR